MIRIYKVSDFKKSGGLKKSAKGLFFNNTDEHGKKDRYERLAKLIKAEGFELFTSHYIFTSINATHPQHGQVIISQSVNVGGSDLPTSPISLLKELLTK